MGAKYQFKIQLGTASNSSISGEWQSTTGTLGLVFEDPPANFYTSYQNQQTLPPPLLHLALVNNLNYHPSSIGIQHLSSRIKLPYSAWVS